VQLLTMNKLNIIIVRNPLFFIFRMYDDTNDFNKVNIILLTYLHKLFSCSKIKIIIEWILSCCVQ